MNTFGGLDAVLTALRMAGEITGDNEPRSIRDIVADHPDLRHFERILGLSAFSFDAYGACTLLAPTDAAFEARAAGRRLLEAALSDRATAEHVIRGHLLARTLTRDMLETDTRTLSLAGHNLLEGLGGNFAAVRSEEIIGSNGVVHVIDRLLLPN